MVGLILSQNMCVSPPPILRDSVFWGMFRQAGIRQSCDGFSKSKSVCDGGSGKVPQLCAIWTPKYDEVKGKLCFINCKIKDLVPDCRMFCKKNISFFFENEERANENL